MEDGDDPARRLADELRGAIEALSSRQLAPEQLAEAAELAAELRHRLDGPPAPRWYDIALAGGLIDEEQIQKVVLTQSLYQGVCNPMAPPLVMEEVDTPTGPGIVGHATLGLAYEGPPHGVHGGYVAGLFDEVLGAIPRLHDKPGVTGRLTVQYRHITPIFEPLTFRGWVESAEGRRVVAKATCHAGDLLTAEAEALFIQVDFAEVQSRMAARRDGA